MKRIISMLLVFALIFSFAACKKDSDKTPTSGESTTLEGQTGEPTGGETEVFTNENGENYTDASGNPVTIPVTVPVSLISEETMPTGKPVEVTTNPSGKPVDSQIDSALGDIFKGEKYSIKFTTQIDLDGTKQTMPAAIYVSGQKSLIELTMSNQALGKMGILNNGTGKYFLISALAGLIKGYITVPADASDEYDDMFNFSGLSDTTDMEYIQTTKVTYKSVEYTAEEYRSEDSTVKFYFNGGKLKRIEQVSDDGSKVFMENIEISAAFDESIFNIPAGYKELKEEDLAGLSGMFG